MENKKYIKPIITEFHIDKVVALCAPSANTEAEDRGRGNKSLDLNSTSSSESGPYGDINRSPFE